MVCLLLATQAFVDDQRQPVLSERSTRASIAFIGGLALWGVPRLVGVQDPVMLEASVEDL